MSFPDKKFLGLKCDGWQDLGSVDGEQIGSAELYSTHILCNRICHVGKEENNLFLFCPRCLIKLGTNQLLTQ